MTTSATVNPNESNPHVLHLSALLDEHRVQSAMVVDDAFDADPERWSELSPSVRSDIRTAIEASPALMELLESKHLLPPEGEVPAAEDHYFDDLERSLPGNEDLLAIWNGLIETQPIRSARKELQELIASLEHLGIAVERSSIVSPKTPPDDVSVIFIDYTLDETDPNDIAAASIAEINRIKDDLPASSKPVFVLMSNKQVIPSEVLQRFRRETNMMPGMFFGHHKDDLKDTRLHVVLTDIVGNRHKAMTLQSFVDDITTASKDAAEAVSSLVEGLTLGDFALIQSLSLNADGQPLGEYILWLMSSYFKQYLQQDQAVRSSEGAVDRMVFATLPITEWGPSDAFLSAYRAAVATGADADIFSDRYPPLDRTAKGTSGPTDDIVAVHFGDLFVLNKRNEHRAYIVLTPECDLAFGGPRPFPHNRSVILLPGKMIDEPPFRGSGGDGTITDLVHWKGKDWRIEWKVKEAESVSLGKFGSWAKKKRLQRIARIEFPFAAAVQSAYIATINRVGLPVLPPRFQPQDAIVYVEAWNKKLIPVTDSIRNGAHLITSPQLQERKCTLSDELIVVLQRNLSDAIEIASRSPSKEDLLQIPDRERESAQSAAKRRVERNANSLRSFSEDPEAILSLRGPHNVEESIALLGGACVTVTKRAKELGYHADTVLTIHLDDA